MKEDDPVKAIMVIEVEGRSRGWPKMRWINVTRRDAREMNVDLDGELDRVS